MGANAQTSVPAFTSGQVLTAQQQTEINTGVPVFATTTTRDAAFGGTGEKVLAQGQLCYLESTNVVQYYNGTAWATLAPGALAVVKAQTSFSAASSVTADNVFSSTYDTYRLVIRYSTSTTNAPFMKFRVGGTAASTNYSYQDLYGGGGGGTSLGTARSFSQTSALIGMDTTGITGVTIVDINGVALASNTLYSATTSSGQVAATTTAQRFVQGNHSTATAYDGIELLVATGTMTGNYTIYGYTNS